MLPRTPEDFILAMRSLLQESINYLDKDLPINIVWEVSKLKELITCYYYYQNNKNAAKTARDMKMSRTTLAYYISINKRVSEIVDEAIEEDKQSLLDIYKKR